MSYSNTNEFLEHYGVKGMHWGQRTAQKASEFKANTKAKINEKLDSSKGGQAVGKLSRYVRDHPVQALGRASAIAAGVYVTKGFVTLGAQLTYDGVKLAAAHYQNSKPVVDFTRKAIGDLNKSIPYSKIVKGVYQVTSLK